MKKITELEIKICGMANIENIQIVTEEILPNYMGFIFYEKSKRFVKDDFIMPKINQHIKKVGVFVNPTQSYVENIIEKYHLDFIQLHAEETPEFCAYIQQKYTHINIIKAFSIDDDFDFDICKEYENVVNYFLWDTKGKQYGGNGTAFDWNILQKYKGNKKCFISGGINPNNIHFLLDFLEKMEQKSVIGIDINSGFELEPALKDIDKLKILIKS